MSGDAWTYTDLIAAAYALAPILIWVAEWVTVTDAEEWERHLKTRPRRALQVVPPCRIPTGESS